MYVNPSAAGPSADFTDVLRLVDARVTVETLAAPVSLFFHRVLRFV